MDQTTFWPGSGGSHSSNISRKMWAARCHDIMTGLYLGLDGFLPSILTEIVNTGPDVTIEAVNTKKSYFRCKYHIHIHTRIPEYVYVYILGLLSGRVELR